MKTAPKRLEFESADNWRTIVMHFDNAAVPLPDGGIELHVFDRKTNPIFSASLEPWLLQFILDNPLRNYQTYASYEFTSGSHSVDIAIDHEDAKDIRNLLGPQPSIGQVLAQLLRQERS